MKRQNGRPPLIAFHTRNINRRESNQQANPVRERHTIGWPLCIFWNDQHSFFFGWNVTKVRVSFFSLVSLLLSFSIRLSIVDEFARSATDCETKCGAFLRFDAGATDVAPNRHGETLEIGVSLNQKQTKNKNPVKLGKHPIPAVEPMKPRASSVATP